MNFKILLGCTVTSFVATLVNYFIQKSIQGQGAGLVIYQFMAIIFISLVVGLLFALESSDFDKKKEIKHKHKNEGTQ